MLNDSLISQQHHPTIKNYTPFFCQGIHNFISTGALCTLKGGVGYYKTLELLSEPLKPYSYTSTLMASKTK